MRRCFIPAIVETNMKPPAMPQRPFTIVTLDPSDGASEVLIVWGHDAKEAVASFLETADETTTRVLACIPGIHKNEHKDC